jgi:hypothetical protein
VETYSIGKESNTSGDGGEFGHSAEASSTVVGGTWTKSTLSIGGDEEPLREGETWETEANTGGYNKPKGSEEGFPS